MAKIAETISSYQTFLKEIKQGQFSPLNLLHGDESYFVDSIVSAFESSVLPEAERSFNQSVLYGKDIKMADLVGMARRYPMMSKFQLIIIKDAQDLKEWDAFSGYAEKPLESTILVFAFRNAKMDLRTKTGKLIAKHKEFNSVKLRDYQIKDWLPIYTQNKGKNIDNDAIQRLIDLLGADLPLIHNELEKVIVTIKEELIRAHHIEEQVGFNREYNVFELQNALGERNFNKSIQIAHQMSVKAEKGEFMRMVPVLVGYFNKITQLHGLKGKSRVEMCQAVGVNNFFLDNYLQAVMNYSMSDLDWVFSQLKYFDLRLKGVHRGAATDGDLLVETVVNILKPKK